MSGLLEIQYGGPKPRENRGRKRGSRDRNYAAKKSVIQKGVEIANSGSTFADAARVIQDEYPRSKTSIKHLAKLIRIASNTAEPKE